MSPRSSAEKKKKKKKKRQRKENEIACRWRDVKDEKKIDRQEVLHSHKLHCSLEAEMRR